MPTPTTAMTQKDYDPRWFIWTIVFLVVTGLSLVSYIVLSDSPSSAIAYVTTAPVKSVGHKTPVK